MGKTRDPFKKVRDIKGTFHAKMRTIKDRKGMDPTIQFSSVQFSRSVMSDSFQPHESQHARLPCPSPTLRVY